MSSAFDQSRIVGPDGAQMPRAALRVGVPHYDGSLTRRDSRPRRMAAPPSAAPRGVQSPQYQAPLRLGAQTPVANDAASDKRVVATPCQGAADWITGRLPDSPETTESPWVTGMAIKPSTHGVRTPPTASDSITFDPAHADWMSVRVKT
jgi:hypothetical protein